MLSDREICASGIFSQASQFRVRWTADSLRIWKSLGKMRLSQLSRILVPCCREGEFPYYVSRLRFTSPTGQSCHRPFSGRSVVPLSTTTCPVEAECARANWTGEASPRLSPVYPQEGQSACSISRGRPSAVPAEARRGELRAFLLLGFAEIIYAASIGFSGTFWLACLLPPPSVF